MLKYFFTEYLYKKQYITENRSIIKKNNNQQLNIIDYSGNNIFYYAMALNMLTAVHKEDSFLKSPLVQ